ncbi:Splicing factor, arginine/serine-rich 19 [Nymphon striatum]|nr:Splicing factor, arginine/serine-rich 19 [Nymphon striatum]
MMRISWTETRTNDSVLILKEANVTRSLIKNIQISPVESLALPDTFEPDLHLLTVCEVCDSGDTEDQLLLCDGCDRGYHCYCLSPTLDEIPIEEWFCSDCAGQVTPEIEESISRRLIARTRASERNDSRPSTSTSRSTARERRRQKRRKSTTKSTSDKFLRRTRYGDLTDYLESERLFCAGQVTPEIEESISRRLIARTRASERNDSRPSTSTSRSTARERRKEKSRKSTTKNTTDKFLRRTRYGDIIDLTDSSDHKSESMPYGDSGTAYNSSSILSTDSEEPIDSETFSETDSDTMISTRSSTSSLRKIVKRGLVTVDGPSTSSGSKVKKTKFIDKSGDFGASNGSVDILDSILKHQSLLHSKSPDSNVTTVSKNLPQCQKPPKDKCYEIAKDLTDVDMDVDTSSYSSDGNMLQISPAKPSTQPSKSGVKTEIPALKTTNDLKTNPINLSLVTNNQMQSYACKGYFKWKIYLNQDMIYNNKYELPRLLRGYWDYVYCLVLFTPIEILTYIEGFRYGQVMFLNKLNQKERAVEEVRLALRPYYHKQDIGKEDYKEIMRKAIPKICKASEINPVKVKSFIEAYVKKCKFERMKRSTLPSSTT